MSIRSHLETARRRHERVVRAHALADRFAWSKGQRDLLVDFVTWGGWGFKIFGIDEDDLLRALEGSTGAFPESTSEIEAFLRELFAKKGTT